MSLKVGCLPSDVGKQPSNPGLHAPMHDISYLCVMSWSRMLNGDDDDVQKHLEHITVDNNIIQCELIEGP